MEKNQNNCVDCNKPLGKHTIRFRCRACDKLYFDRIHKEACLIVETGKCPRCGSGLKRNIALAGWYQCEQYGSEQFRKDPSKPTCSFQVFTE